MKKNIILIAATISMLSSVWSARALDWSYSTNLFWMLDGITNVFYGEGPSDTNRFNYHQMVNAFNHNDIWMAGYMRTVNDKLTNYMGTNPPSGGGSTNTIQITNMITAYNLSNAWLGSMRVVTFTTNNAAWGASNYLARVSGLYSWKLEPGNDGGNPPMGIPMSLVGSYNGSNSWFTITNGFRTTNTISVAAITNGLSARGSPRATLGQATLFSVDNWELLGRKNYGFGQFYRFDDPVENDDAATKKYVDTGLANVTDHNFTTYTDTNTTTAHLIYQRYGMTLFDIASRTSWVLIKGVSLSGTNVLLDIYQTNLTAGWFIESTTNLALFNSWVTWTNYTMATNTGVVTFTTPILPGEEQRFYRGRGNSTNSVAVNAPLVLPITTPASSTATTYGHGAGVVLVDTNYVYVSVGTNAWKRASLSSW